jgi:hypothetical protein
MRDNPPNALGAGQNGASLRGCRTVPSALKNFTEGRGGREVKNRPVFVQCCYAVAGGAPLEIRCADYMVQGKAARRDNGSAYPCPDRSSWSPAGSAGSSG